MQRLKRSISGRHVRGSACPSRARSAVAGAEVVEQAAELGAGRRSARPGRATGSDAAIVAGGSRTPGTSSRANARVGGSALRRGCAKPCRAFAAVGPEQAHGLAPARRMRRHGGHGRVEVVRGRAAPARRARGRCSCAASPSIIRDRSCGARCRSSASVRRCADPRSASALVLERLVERLGAGEAAHVRSPGRRRRRRSARSRRPSPRPRRVFCSEPRVSDWSAVSTWSSWTGRDVWRHRDQAAVVELLGARRARLEVDVEVALEEQPRADLDRRVAVGSAARCPGSPS